jgi:hypothetical protein
MGRRIAFGLAAAVLALGIAATPADAAKKNCKKLCKASFTACKTDECGALTGKEKRLCKKACKEDFKALKLLCKERAETAPDTCSPSGAFID